MAIKYYKLLDLLNKRGIFKGELQRMAGFSSATMAKFSSNGKISIDMIDKVCIALKVQPGDIMECVFDEDILSDTK